MIHGAFSYARQSGLNKKAQKVVGYGEITGSGRKNDTRICIPHAKTFSRRALKTKKNKTAKRT